MATTLLIVDDHGSFRRAARRLLEKHGYDVVGEAADGEAALEAVKELRPDAVLLDVQMPGMGGFEVAARLEGGPAIVMVSSRDLQDYGDGPPFIPKEELSGPALDAALSG